jgi:pyruvyl transferase EpsI
MVGTKQFVAKIALRTRLQAALFRAEPDQAVRSTETDRAHVFVGLAADYGNVGDLAITHAQTQFLALAFPDSVIEPIPISRTLRAVSRLRQVIQPSDVITLIGGGNTGDMYDDIQYLREMFIRSFPNNRIISFPQTVDFSSGRYGRWAGRRAGRIYSAHKHLGFLARDTRSAASAKTLFPSVPTEVAPDVVLTVDATEPRGNRSGVLVALRVDLERGLREDERRSVVAALERVGQVRHRDTHIGDTRIGRAAAKDLLEDYWSDWRSAAVVVTDRLHGMIFAVITDTPCVALDSGTGKVSQFYRDWLEEHSKVQLVSSSAPSVVLDAVRQVQQATAPAPDLAAEFERRFAAVVGAIR